MATVNLLPFLMCPTSVCCAAGGFDALFAIVAVSPASTTVEESPRGRVEKLWCAWPGYVLVSCRTSCLESPRPLLCATACVCAACCVVRAWLWVSVAVCPLLLVEGPAMGAVGAGVALE
jgi:hypothetical protein